MNMLATIVPKSDQINADDLIGKTMTITVREVRFNGGQEQPVSMYFDGSDKAFRPCKSMCRVLVAAWGPDAKEYVGRSMTLYRDPSVKWGGLEVGGIRISHMTNIDSSMTMALTATKGARKPFTVKPLTNLAAGQVEALSLDQARADLEAATTLDELRTTWSRKSMAPHRDALQSVLDERKAALSFEGPSDDQRGEAHNGTDDTHPARGIADGFIARADAAQTTADLERAEADFNRHRESFSVELDGEVVEAIDRARTRLSV